MFVTQQDKVRRTLGFAYLIFEGGMKETFFVVL